MKKILLILLLVFCFTGLFSQKYTDWYTVPNKTTQFGRTIPVGWIIYEQDSLSFYAVTVKFTATQTMADVFTSGNYNEVPESSYHYWTRFLGTLSPMTSTDNVNVTDTLEVDGASIFNEHLFVTNTKDINLGSTTELGGSVNIYNFNKGAYAGYSELNSTHLDFYNSANKIMSLDADNSSLRIFNSGGIPTGSLQNNILQLGSATLGDANAKIVMYDLNGYFTEIEFGVGGLTGNSSLELPDKTGIIALTSDIPSTPALSSVLAVGNTSGGTDIVMGSDSIHLGANAKINGTTKALQLRNYGLNGALLHIQNQEYTFNDDAIGVASDIIRLSLATANPQIHFQRNSEGNLGILRTASLPTASRTWTLPDNTGTIALTSDIPTGAGLWSKTDGTIYPTTNGDTLDVGSSSLIQFNGSDFISTPLSTNTFIGLDVGHASITTGDGNIGIGKQALETITEGDNNVAIGTGALDKITTGYGNVGIGTGVLGNSVDGFYNVAIGLSALSLAGTTFGSTAIGFQAGVSVTSGYHNTLLGYRAGSDLQTTSYNVAIGNSSMINSTGADNTAIGYNSLGNNDGNNNTAIGYQSLYTGNGDFNVALGEKAGYSTTGSSNLFLGYNAGYNETGSNLLYIANSNTATPLILGDFNTGAVTVNTIDNSGLTDAFVVNDITDGNLFVVDDDGYFAFYDGVDNLAGVDDALANTYMGFQSANTISSGTNNSFFGYRTGKGITTGGYNVAIGNEALGVSTNSLSSAIAIGHYAGRQATVSGIFIGSSTGRFNAGLRNIYIGDNAGGDVINTGANNVFIGTSAGFDNQSGADNTFVGRECGWNNTTGSSNIFYGNRAGGGNTTGSFNTYIGFNNATANQTGSRNVFIGYGTGASETGSDKLYIDVTGITNPLIYGEFDNDLIKINGDFEVVNKFALLPAVDSLYLATETLVSDTSLIRVGGSGGAVTMTSTPTIVAGTIDGQILSITGTDDTNTVTLVDDDNDAGTKLELAGSIDFTMGKYDKIVFEWYATDSVWIEVSRSNN